MLQTLREKQKYQVTNVGTLTLLVQHINEFKMNEIQHKTTVKFRTVMFGP